MLMRFQNELLAVLAQSGKPPEMIIMPADEKEKIETALKDAETRLAILNKYILNTGTEITELQAKGFFGDKDFNYFVENSSRKDKKTTFLV
jgi:hypothetical protein